MNTTIKETANNKTSSVNDMSLYLALQDLYARYACALNDGPLDDWPELFTVDCLYLLIPRDNYDRGLPMAIMRAESRDMLIDRVRSVKETIMHEPRYLRHHITNIRVLRRGEVPQLDKMPQLDEGQFQVTANYSVIEVLQDELPRILNCGRYLDTIHQQGNGELLFKEKTCVYDSVLVPNSIIYPV